MTQVLPVLGALAATIAAVLAGVNLWVAGKRAERAWVRDALIEVLAAYLQSSFHNEARAALEGRVQGSTAAQLADWRRACDEAHTDQMQALTRLRLLAPAGLVSAAEDLHAADHEVTTYAFDVPDAGLGRTWQELRKRQEAARGRVIDQARATIGLGKGSQIAQWVGRDPSALGGASAASG